MEVPRDQDDRRNREDTATLFEALGRAEKVYRAVLKTSDTAVNYLKTRGVTGVVARDFGIGFAPDAWHTVEEAFKNSSFTQADLLKAGLLTRNDKGNVYDRFRDRIMFPIRDTRGRVMGFGGRVMGNSEGPKYLNSPETPVFHKGRELYGLYEARNALRRIEQLIVVEGYMDVVALAQSGVANAVASLGTAATTDHFHKLYRYCEEVVCCFDGDAAGRRAAWKALENALSTLTDGRQLKFMFLPDGEDPDSLVRKEGKEAFLNRVKAAAPAIEYLFNELSNGLDLNQLDDQARLASLVSPYIERVPDGVLKQLMRNRLAQLTGLSGGGPRSRPQQSRPAREPDQHLSPLNRRLLHYLLQAPELLTVVDEQTRRAVAEAAETDLFAEIVSYIDEHPDTDRSDILGRWAGQPIAEELARLAGQPLALTREAVAQELADGLASYVAGKAKHERLRILSELQQEPSPEKLKTLTELQRKQGGERE